jgi:hypothetical protein
MPMPDSQRKKTRVRLGKVRSDETWYDVKVTVEPLGEICLITVTKEDDPDEGGRHDHNFPITISLTGKDGLELASAICNRLAKFINAAFDS